MEVILICLFVGISLFTWPLYHAIKGRNRKEKLLRRIFIFLLLGVGFFTGYYFLDDSRDRTLALIVMTELIVSTAFLASLCVLIFVREKSSSKNGASEQLTDVRLHPK